MVEKGMEGEKQIELAAKTNKSVAKMTQGLPEDIRKDQENKLRDLFNKENNIIKKLSKNSNAIDIIRNANSGFKDGYESVKKYAVQNSTLKDMANSDIGLVVDKLNEIIKIYDNVLNDFSDKKEMKKILRDN